MYYYGPERQTAQAAILNDITEVPKFDKIKLVQKTKGQVRGRYNKTYISKVSMQVLQGQVMCQGNVQHMGKHILGVGKLVTSRKCA